MSDNDSLFGSPPPSPPTRGRSPSLALPESSEWRLDAQTSSQNVGTIALPGSHNISSELPVFNDTALPSGNYVLQLRPPAQRANAPQRRQDNTSNAAPSVSRLPSPAPHNTQTDRTLRDLVGLISHFEPVATASSSRPRPIAVSSSRASHPPELHPPGTAQNPIEIDAPGPADAVNNALIALAGTVASALKLPTTPRDAPSLSEPTVNNVLHCIKHDPKLIPALQATYEYLGSIPNNSQLPPRSFSHVTTNQPEPPKRKRKRKYPGPKIPAGAGHWDVPFPFAPGQEPSGYPSQWQLERGRRVLGELLGLFERGFAKARGDDGTRSGGVSAQRPTKKRRTHDPKSAVGSEFEGSVVGGDGKNSTSLVGTEGSGLDHQRMTDWLSSVPALPSSSSIMDSTNMQSMPSPSPSDPAPSSSNSLLDLMAILGPDFPGEPSTHDGDKEHDFDYAGAFDELDAGMGGGDCLTWQSVFGPGPASQSINDITAFPMNAPDLPSSTSSANDFVIDPALMALSQPQQGPPPYQAVLQSPLAAAVDLPNSAFLAAANDALASLMGSSAIGQSSQRLQLDQSASIGVSTEVDFGDTQSVDAHSLFTVPTGLAWSSRRGSTPTVEARSALSPAPSVAVSSSTSGQTKVQRRTAVLIKAREHRERLVKELERAKVERWELLIEGGVLRNLELAGGP